MKNQVTQTSLGERILHSGIFAGISTGFIAVTQYFTGQQVHEILQSSGAEFTTSYISSFVNSTFYNSLKKQLDTHTNLSEKDIVLASIFFVSLLGVGVPKYLVHKFAGTLGSEYIALSYFFANAFVLWFYEKSILGKNKSK